MNYFNYDPMSEEDCIKAKYKLLPDGIYPGVIQKSTQKLSKSGNDMAELLVTVYDETGNGKSIKDWLPFAKEMMWKWKHLCDSANLTKEYFDRKLHADLVLNKNVFVQVGTRKGELIPDDKLDGKPKGTCYPDTNMIKDYVTGDKLPQVRKSMLTPLGMQNKNIDEDVPF